MLIVGEENILTVSFCSNPFYGVTREGINKHFELNIHKTGVINDPLGQPTVAVGSDCRLILKFWDGRTDTLCENSDQ